MKKTIFLSLFVALTIGIMDCYAQGDRIYGPVIEEYGSIFSVPNPEFQTDPNKTYKVVFDIHSSPEDPAALSPMLNTLARFLNMHVQAGVPLENLKVVGVIHNKASKDAMNNKAYRKQFGVNNPNLPLMEALVDAGAEIYMCGQSMSARNVEQEKLAKPVKTALSAMTVFIALQNEGYTLIRF